eukprot:s377_g12.t1
MCSPSLAACTGGRHSGSLEPTSTARVIRVHRIELRETGVAFYICNAQSSVFVQSSHLAVEARGAKVCNAVGTSRGIPFTLQMLRSFEHWLLW